ncbi:MAG: isocitrate lyase/PEP mutase family protein [Acidimicrobiales bacterium]
MTDTPTVQASRAEAFRDLHAGPDPLRLVNAWDGLSARVFARSGAPAIGTSSFAVALANGYQDGQRIAWSRVCQVIADIVAAAGEVPVTADIEAGQGAHPDDVARSVSDVLAAGAVGVNIEDSDPGAPGTLFDVHAQSRRLAAAREVGEKMAVPLFINARCDVHFGAPIPPDDRLPETLRRAHAYVEAGADGLFLPGLVDLDALRTVIEEVPAPVNVMLWPGLPPIDELAAIGVRRISQGGAAFLLDVGYLERTTRAFLDGPHETAGGDVVPAFHLIGELVHRA